MGFYDYKCQECGEMKLERKISEIPVKHCPKCKGKIERIYKPIPSIWNCSGNFGKSE